MKVSTKVLEKTNMSSFFMHRLNKPAMQSTVFLVKQFCSVFLSSKS